MKVLYDIQDMLEDELKKICKKEEISTTDLDNIYKMVDIVKDVTTVEAIQEIVREIILGAIQMIMPTLMVLIILTLVGVGTVTEMVDIARIVLIVEAVMLWVGLLPEIVLTMGIADIAKTK